MADTERVVVPGLTHWQHPNFFAYFPANSSYPAILGDLLTAGLGVQGMSWVTGPACTEIETLMVDWMHELLGLPDALPLDQRERRRGDPRVGQRSDAGFDTGGPLAHHQRRGQRRRRHVATRCVRDIAGAHSSIEKGLRIAGIGTDRLRVVPHDRPSRCGHEALAR